MIYFYNNIPGQGDSNQYKHGLEKGSENKYLFKNKCRKHDL